MRIILKRPTQESAIWATITADTADTPSWRLIIAINFARCCLLQVNERYSSKSFITANSTKLWLKTRPGKSLKKVNRNKNQSATTALQQSFLGVIVFDKIDLIKASQSLSSEIIAWNA